MNDLTSNIIGDYVPAMAVVVYKWHDNTKHDYYLECHEIDGKGNMLAGKALESDMLDGLAEYLNERRKENSQVGGIVPGGVLLCIWNEKNKVMVWYNEPRERQMFFTKYLQIKSGKAWQPGLLYVLQDDDLDVYALNCSGRPDSKTSLYRAPYHNVNAMGEVCMGSAQIAKPKVLTYESVINYWEAMFWNSEFSHLAGGDSPIKGNLNMLWQELIKPAQKNKGVGGTGKPFPHEVLLKAKVLNIDALFKKLLK